MIKHTESEIGRGSYPKSQTPDFQTLKNAKTLDILHMSETLQQPHSDPENINLRTSWGLQKLAHVLKSLLRLSVVTTRCTPTANKVDWAMPTDRSAKTAAEKHELRTTPQTPPKKNKKNAGS